MFGNQRQAEEVGKNTSVRIAKGRVVFVFLFHDRARLCESANVASGAKHASWWVWFKSDSSARTAATHAVSMYSAGFAYYRTSTSMDLLLFFFAIK